MTPLFNTIIVYCMLCGFLFSIKPRIMFDNTGNFKSFGLNKNKNETIFPFWLVTLNFGLLTYYIQIINQSNILD